MTVRKTLRLPARRPRPNGVPAPPRLSVADLLAEAVAAVTARPVRSALTTLGTVLGIATFVITLGVGATADNQIVGRFDAVRATEVTVAVPKVAGGGTELVRWPAADDLTRLNGVAYAAAITGLEEVVENRLRYGSGYSIRSRELPPPPLIAPIPSNTRPEVPLTGITVVAA